MSPILVHVLASQRGILHLATTMSGSTTNEGVKFNGQCAPTAHCEAASWPYGVEYPSEGLLPVHAGD
jgi:hypothetical protein